MRNPLLHDPDWLRARYIDDRMSTIDIAKLAGVPNANATTVRRALVRAGIPRRTISEARLGQPSAFKGRRHTEESKAKQRAAKIGKPSKAVWTEEMRASVSGGSNPNYRHGMSIGMAATTAARKEAKKLHPTALPCNRCGAEPDVMHRHHRDECITNNSAENIEWLCPRCHKQHHMLGKSRIYQPDGSWVMGRAGAAPTQSKADA